MRDVAWCFTAFTGCCYGTFVALRTSSLRPDDSESLPFSSLCNGHEIMKSWMGCQVSQLFCFFLYRPWNGNSNENSGIPNDFRWDSLVQGSRLTNRCRCSCCNALGCWPRAAVPQHFWGVIQCAYINNHEKKNITDYISIYVVSPIYMCTAKKQLDK